MLEPGPNLDWGETCSVPGHEPRWEAADAEVLFHYPGRLSDSGCYDGLLPDYDDEFPQWGLDDGPTDFGSLGGEALDLGGEPLNFGGEPWDLVWEGQLAFVPATDRVDPPPEEWGERC